MRLFRRFFLLLRFFLFYVGEVLLSNLAVARDILTPGLNLRPGIVAIPLEPLSDWELLLLTNLITMTPGTLSLEVSSDRRRLFVHVLYLDDAEEFRRRTKRTYERYLREIFSWNSTPGS